ncbi:rhodanese-like domain-containing protein [Lutimonas sp.]|uniref:rhodanese-like domain-containing protein n=1 Tax=Lutimonas sp. TaxID=1872403 RepID=UPI003D9B31A6
MKIKKSHYLFIALLSISLVSCGQKQKKGSATEEAETTISLISPSELNNRNEDILIIDVRTPEEFASGHLENSVNIDYKADNFEELVGELDRNQDVYVYCKVGGRSGRSAKVLEDLGFKKVYDLDGGIIAWEKDGLKTVK